VHFLNPFYLDLASLGMKHNVGSLDRILRLLVGIAMLVSSVVAPVSLSIAGAIGLTGGYMLFTSLAGTCLGYRMIGRSTCTTR
jgi:hypothetical protein